MGIFRRSSLKEQQGPTPSAAPGTLQRPVWLEQSGRWQRTREGWKLAKGHTTWAIVGNCKDTGFCSSFQFLSRGKTWSDLPLKRINLATLWVVNYIIGGGRGTEWKIWPLISVSSKPAGGEECKQRGPACSKLLLRRSRQAVVISRVILLGPGPLRLSAWISPHSNSFTLSFFSSSFPGFLSYSFEDDQFFLVWCVPQTFFCFCDSRNPSEDQFLKMCWSPMCRISL